MLGPPLLCAVQRREKYNGHQWDGEPIEHRPRRGPQSHERF
jgi:hypothetical protein